MIKQALLSILILTSLSATQALAIAFRPSSQQVRECRFKRYLFPIYKTSDNTYFVPIRNEADNLKLPIIEAPFQDQKNIESVWQSYNEARDDTKDFNSQETKKNFELLENSTLVDFAVFLHCDWNEFYKDKEYSWLVPYLLGNSTLVAQVQDAKPYFDIMKRKTANLSNYGVVFQVSHAKAIAFEELLVNTQDRIAKEVVEKAKEAAKKAATKGEL